MRAASKVDRACGELDRGASLSGIVRSKLLKIMVETCCRSEGEGDDRWSIEFQGKDTYLEPLAGALNVALILAHVRALPPLTVLTHSLISHPFSSHETQDFTEFLALLCQLWKDTAPHDQGSHQKTPDIEPVGAFCVSTVSIEVIHRI